MYFRRDKVSNNILYLISPQLTVLIPETINYFCLHKTVANKTFLIATLHWLIPHTNFLKYGASSPVNIDIEPGQNSDRDVSCNFQMKFLKFPLVGLLLKIVFKVKGHQKWFLALIILHVNFILKIALNKFVDHAIPHKNHTNILPSTNDR